MYEKSAGHHEHHHAPLHSKPSIVKGLADLPDDDESHHSHGHGHGDEDPEDVNEEAKIVDDHELKHNHDEASRKYSFLNRLEDEEE